MTWRAGHIQDKLLFFTRVVKNQIHYIMFMGEHRVEKGWVQTNVNIEGLQENLSSLEKRGSTEANKLPHIRQNIILRLIYNRLDGQIMCN